MDRIPPGRAPVSDTAAAWLRAVPPAPPAEAPCVDDGVLLALGAGRLPDDRLAAVDRHLATCAACRSLLRELAAPVPERVFDALVSATPLPATRRWWPALVAAALAAGVTLMLLPFGGPSRVPAYVLHGPYGGVQQTRSVQATHVFGPDSRLKILLRPSADLTGGTPTLRAFVAKPGGVLVAVPESAVTGGVGGAWRLQAPAASLFTAAGKYTVHLALTNDAATTAGLAGRTPEQARRATRAARWMTLELEYRDE